MRIGSWWKVGEEEGIEGRIREMVENTACRIGEGWWRGGGVKERRKVEDRRGEGWIRIRVEEWGGGGGVKRRRGGGKRSGLKRRRGLSKREEGME